MRRRRVLNLDARQVIELNRLNREREGTRDESLRGDDGGHGGQYHQGNDRPLRCHLEERALDGLGVAEDECRLAEVVQDQGGQHHEVPRELNWLAPEVSHVGVEGLAAGDHEEDGAQGEEGLHRRFGEEVRRIDRVDRLQHAGPLNDLVQTEARQGGEPDHHDRTENASDATCSTLLNQKEDGENRDGDGDDQAVESGGGFLHAFDGGEHRDGRRDESVAVQQCGAENAEHDGNTDTTTSLAFGHDHGREGENSTFTVVVGAHDEDQVLDRDDDHESPEGQRRDAHGIDAVTGIEMMLLERLAKRIQGRRADVAVHDSERSQCQGPHTHGVSAVGVVSAGFARRRRTIVQVGDRPLFGIHVAMLPIDLLTGRSRALAFAA